jgi:hypothetical protein
MSNVSFLGSLEEWHDCDSFGIAIRRITTTSCTIVGIPPAAQDIPALLSVYLPTLEEGSLALGARPEESARSSVEFGTARGLASSVGCCTISFGSPLLQRTPSSLETRARPRSRGGSSILNFVTLDTLCTIMDLQRSFFLCRTEAQTIAKGLSRRRTVHLCEESYGSYTCSSDSPTQNQYAFVAFEF